MTITFAVSRVRREFNTHVTNSQSKHTQKIRSLL